MGDFHQLMVWQKAHQLTPRVYRVTATFPNQEVFGLTSQLRRATLSIPANSAEGSARGGDRDFVRFLRIANGSAAEVEYHLLLARGLGYLGAQDFADLTASVNEVKGMLRRLIERLLTRDSARPATRVS